MTNVFIVDDDSSYRESLKLLIEQTIGLRFAGESGGGLRVVEQIMAAKPDLVLMDVVMPGCDGIEIAAELAVRMPTIRVIVLTSFVHTGSLLRSVQAFASGFVAKGSKDEVLVSAIKRVSAGDVYFDRTLKTLLAEV